MGLPPLLDMPGVFWAAEVIAIGWLAKPPALAGLFASLAASGFAAVVLALLVAVIGQEKLAATKALTSLGAETHVESEAPR